MFVPLLERKALVDEMSMLFSAAPAYIDVSGADPLHMVCHGLNLKTVSGIASTHANRPDAAEDQWVGVFRKSGNDDRYVQILAFTKN